jgi:hypothetical protein
MAMGVPEAPGVTPPGMGPFSAPPPPPTGAFFGSSGAQPEARMPQSQVQNAAQQKTTARREMAGPSGVEDILKTFEEVRRAEANTMPVYSSQQPAVEATTRGAASVVSEDMSYSESINTGTGSTGRRRRRAQPPSGSTISLNV